MFRKTICIVIVLGCVLFASQTFAGKRIMKKKNRYIMKTIVINGIIQKPQAFYVLSRSSLQLRYLKAPKRGFLKKVVGAVKKNPF